MTFRTPSKATRWSRLVRGNVETPNMFLPGSLSRHRRGMTTAFMALLPHFGDAQMLLKRCGTEPK